MAQGVIPEGVAMRGYGTSTAPYSSARAHVKIGSFVFNDGMPGFRAHLAG